MLTWEQKEYRMQVCKDLLNQHKAEADSSLDSIVTSDRIWYHAESWSSQKQSMQWQREFPNEEKVKSPKCCPQWVQ